MEGRSTTPGRRTFIGVDKIAGWLAIRSTSGSMHILPRLDRADHWMDSYCPCMPTTHWEGNDVFPERGGWMVTHNSWDARESTEGPPQDSAGGTLIAWRQSFDFGEISRDSANQ